MFRDVTKAESDEALCFALSKVGCKYHYGGNGPDLFDCSGLIIWSYQQVCLESYLFKYRTYKINDLTVDMLHNENVKIIDIKKVVPGDIVFITNGYDISHAGIFISNNSGIIRFINASTYFDEITIEEWDINSIIRDQWIVDFGRIKIARNYLRLFS